MLPEQLQNQVQRLINSYGYEINTFDYIVPRLYIRHKAWIELHGEHKFKAFFEEPVNNTVIQVEPRDEFLVPTEYFKDLNQAIWFLLEDMTYYRNFGRKRFSGN